MIGGRGGSARGSCCMDYAHPCNSLTAAIATRAKSESRSKCMWPHLAAAPAALPPAAPPLPQPASTPPAQQPPAPWLPWPPPPSPAPTAWRQGSRGDALLCRKRMVPRGSHSLWCNPHLTHELPKSGWVAHAPAAAHLAARLLRISCCLLLLSLLGLGLRLRVSLGLLPGATCST